MSSTQSEVSLIGTVVLSTADIVYRFKRTIWSLNDNHWDIDEIFSLVLDAISKYAHCRPDEHVVDIHFNYSIDITEELYSDTIVMRQATNQLGLDLLRRIKQLGTPIGPDICLVYAGLSGNDIVVEIRKIT